MKRNVLSRVIFAALAVGIPVSCGYQEPPSEEESAPAELTGTSEQAATIQDQDWWRSLSQMERNQAILDRSARDINMYVGLNCKQWVQRVVADASRGVVWVPTTYPDAYGWTWNSSKYAVRVYMDIRTVQPGWIVQMNRWGRNGGITPHTAIVVGRSTDGIYWIESNYAPKFDDNTVRLRSETFADFERATFINGTYRYSMYYVRGG